MKNRSFTPMLLVGAALAIACGNEGPFDSNPAPPFTLLQIGPNRVALAAAAPGNTVQLTVYALYRSNVPSLRTDEATYSSSDPAIAEVTGLGFVTARAPGTAEITATLTLGGMTRTASMTVTVHDRDYSDLAGVYDLNALITDFDPAWGDLEGYRYTAVVTLQDEPGPYWVGGRYTDLRLIGPNSDSLAVTDTGRVFGSFGYYGELLIELPGEGDRVGLTLVVGELKPGFIDGHWGCCGFAGGTFTAVSGKR
jgi:Big-like domain-containing protein